MTTIDNSKIFYEGVYTDVSVKVPANTVYREGLVLGRNAQGDVEAYTTDNNDSSNNFTCEPLFILAQTINNDSDAAQEFPLVRVFETGTVDKNKIIFHKEADAEDDFVWDRLKINGFNVTNVCELS